MPLEHLAEYTDALTQVFRKHGTKGTWYAHASVGTLHVRPILDMRTPGRAEDARHRRGSLGAGAQVQGRLQRRARRRPVPRRVDRLAVRPEDQRGLRADQGTCSTREQLLCPQAHHRSAAHGRHAADALRAGLQGHPAADRAGLERLGRAERPGHRAHHARPAPAATRRRASPRPWRCATTTAIAASSTPAPCARATASRATRSTDARPRQHAAPGARRGQLGRHRRSPQHRPSTRATARCA